MIFIQKIEPNCFFDLQFGFTDVAMRITDLGYQKWYFVKDSIPTIETMKGAIHAFHID